MHILPSTKECSFSKLTANVISQYKSERHKVGERLTCALTIFAISGKFTILPRMSDREQPLRKRRCMPEGITRSNAQQEPVLTPLPPHAERPTVGGLRPRRDDAISWEKAKGAVPSSVSSFDRQQREGGNNHSIVFDDGKHKPGQHEADYATAEHIH